MKNPIKALKAQQKANEIFKILTKLKKESIVDYKWYGLACASGIVCDINCLMDPIEAIRRAKEIFSHVKTEEQLDELLVIYKDSVEDSAKKYLGKFYTSKMLKQ